MLRRLSTRDPDFQSQWQSLLQAAEAEDLEARQAAADIIAAVRAEGDAALLRFTARFDGWQAQRMEELRTPPEALKAAFDATAPSLRAALEEAAARIRAYHEAQLAACGGMADWQYEDADGNALGQKLRPLERVGLYAPGGKAAYPSTILMTAIPARVAGVGELILCVPMPGGPKSQEARQTLLAAAHLAGVDQMFSLGGAQAVAALAYGTQTVPRVDKIVGPGNVYVAAAKQLVVGQVGIDMIAGPSEVLIIADETADPDWVLLDLFAQAEHDETAQALLITPSERLAEAVLARLPKRLAQMQRRGVIEASLASRGALVLAADLAEAAQLANRMAPEHLQLAVADPEALLGQVRHAGAVFLGRETAEVVGDYTAGPSHVLPTAGRARFSSPLGVHDFVSRMSVVRCSRQGALRLNRAAAILAQAEGLGAHAEAASARVRG